MLQIAAMKIKLTFTAAILCCVSIVRGDEQLFGFVRGAETLPAHRWEVCQFVTLGERKSEGTYYGTHFETEAEYGLTNQFQASLSLIQHYFYNKGVDGDRDALDTTNAYRFGGFVKLTGIQHKAIEQTSGVRVLRDEQQVWRVSGGGWLIVDEVVGKHEFITSAVGLNADGPVKQIEIMDYRETYGGQI